MRDMTFREKLAQEHPNRVNRFVPGGCEGCPHTYGYEEKSPCQEMGTCRECWNREIPMTPEEQKQHDLEINAEILRAYCTHKCGSCPAIGPCSQMSGVAWSRMPYNAEKQRAMLDAFEAALPPEDDAPAEAAPQEIPQAVRELVEARIRDLTEQVKALEAERDALCGWLNGVGI